MPLQTALLLALLFGFYFCGASLIILARDISEARAHISDLSGRLSAARRRAEKAEWEAIYFDRLLARYFREEIKRQGDPLRGLSADFLHIDRMRDMMRADAITTIEIAPRPYRMAVRDRTWLNPRYKSVDDVIAECVENFLGGLRPALTGMLADTFARDPSFPLRAGEETAAHRAALRYDLYPFAAGSWDDRWTPDRPPTSGADYVEIEERLRRAGRSRSPERPLRSPV